MKGNANDGEFQVSYWLTGDPGEPTHTEKHARLGDALIALGGLLNDRPIENSRALLARGGTLLMGLRVADGQWRAAVKERGGIIDIAGGMTCAYLIAYRIEGDISGRVGLGAEWRRIDDGIRAGIRAAWERIILDGLMPEPRRP